MNERIGHIEDLKLEAGPVCLEFANTADWHASDRPVEYLNSYEDLVVWAEKKGVLPGNVGQSLREQAKREPARAAAVLAQAIELREAIYRIFSATAANRSPDPVDLALLNRVLPTALTHLQIKPHNSGFAWQWPDEPVALDRMLWPVIRSAAELLTSADLDRAKECEDAEGCGFLFFDTSKNRSRRWCDMRGCGNRAKVRRYRRRQAVA